MKKIHIGFYIAIASLSVLLIIFLATGLWKKFIPAEEEDFIRTRIVTPGETGSISIADQSGHSAWGDNISTKIPLENDEIVIAVLNIESEFSLSEDQFAVYRIASETGPVNITLLSYDNTVREYKRMWSLPAAATRPETISLFSQDLIGDRNSCIIITGMNANNEHTMTILRRNRGQPAQQEYLKIAELQIAGSIVIQETTRTFAYHQGIASGRSHNIVTYGPDPRSANLLDQLETTYSYNPVNTRFEQASVTRIPGSQIEQRRVREILSGRPGVFEDFIDGLWYYISPQGTIDTRRYLYFDPAGKEVVFYGEGSQQVFRWQTSSYTRFGIYIRSQNISITTLMRFINIELESLDRIRVRVDEDVRLKITVSAPWDGSYRRARAAPQNNQTPQIAGAVDALYDSSWGRLQFFDTGEYSITSSGNTRRGRYVFFKVDGNDLLELRPEDNTPSDNRMVYRIENTAGVRILFRVSLGVNGIQDLLEPPVTLTLVES